MDDAKIVDLYWQRSGDAIRETADKYGKLCRIVAYNILNSEEDAEECVNDTWLRAWNAMPADRPTALGAYLSKIARNCALMRLRAGRALKRGGGEAPLALEELADCIAAEETPETELLRRELARALDAFLATLPEAERRLFLGRYWLMAPIDELAHRFGYSRSKVTSSLYRSRQKLKRYLEQEGLC